MLQELSTAHERVESGLKAVKLGEDEVSKQALEDVLALRNQLSEDLRKLDAKATMLERDIGMRLYVEGSPWQIGFRQRMIGLLPASPADTYYLRGWEIADRLVQYGLQGS